MDDPDGRVPSHGPDGPRGQPPPPEPSVRRRRRWPSVVVGLAAVAVILGAGAVAVEQREVAATWRERSETLQAQRDAGLERERLLVEQRDELTALVVRSEDDVVVLEDRLRALADEKAQAEDTATTVQVERDVFSEVTGRISAATEALDGCVERLFELQTASVEAFNRSMAGEEVDVAPLNATAAQVTASCNDARSAAASAGAAADRVLIP